MRIDRLLCALRFVRTRSMAQGWIEGGHIRLNGQRVTRSAQTVRIGDVLTFPWGDTVRLIEVIALPERRGPPREAQGHYRELDRGGQSDLAAHM